MCRIHAFSGLVLLALLLAPAWAAADDASDAVALLPAQYRADVTKSLAKAGGNAAELIGAIRAVKAEQREAVAYLLAYMPERDLVSLKKDFIVENVEYSYRALAEAPWGKDIPRELFLNDILPYASINERRDRWRKDFFDRFMPLAKKCKTPGEAAVMLNRTIYHTLGVRYHASKRPKPDQSPYESTEAKFASCTGLAVMLVDACRAVGVPARFAGVPIWYNRSGNHSWVEVWDRQWNFTGAAEPGKLNHTWFNGNARRADVNRRMFSVYASSFRRTGTSFPLVWDRSINYVPAFNVSPFYTARRTVKFRLKGKKPAELLLRLDGRIVAKDLLKVKDTTEFELAGGLTYQAEMTPLGSKKVVKKAIAVPAQADDVIEVGPGED